MKKFILLIGTVLMISLLCSCSNGNVIPSDSIERTPTMSQLKDAIHKHGYTIKPMVKAISSNIADLKKIGFSDVNLFTQKYKEIYGTFDLSEDQSTTFTNTAQMAQLASASYTKKEKFAGPILLVKNAKLIYDGGTSKAVNILFLNGTDFSFSSIILPASQNNNKEVIKSAA